MALSVALNLFQDTKDAKIRLLAGKFAKFSTTKPIPAIKTAYEALKSLPPTIFNRL